MASIVKIELQMDENGVVTGFRNVDAAGAKVQTTFKAVAMSGSQMTDALKQTAVSANEAGEAMRAAGAKGAAAMDSVHSHTLTSLDSVRLFRDLFGIHIPRSMEKAMASSQAVMGVLGAMQGAMLGFGAVGIGVALGKQIWDAGEYLLKADDALKTFSDDLEKTGRQKFFDSASIEDVRDSLQGATSDLARYQSQVAAMPKSVLGRLVAQQWGADIGTMDVFSGKALATSQAGLEESLGTKNKAAYRDEENRHSTVMNHIAQEEKAMSSMMDGGAKNSRSLSLQLEKNAESRLYRLNMAHARANEANEVVDPDTGAVTYKKPGDEHYQAVDPNSGASEQAQANALAKADFTAKNVEVARQEADEIRRLEREANNTSLRGYQLLEAQRLQAREDFVHKYGTSTTALASIDQRYYAEEKRASEQLARELERDRREASLSGLSGIGLAQARGRNKDADIDGQLTSGRFSAFGDQAQQQAAADALKQQNHDETNAEIEKEEQRFTDSIDQMAMQSADKQVQGFARINAETSKQLTDLQKKFNEVYGDIADKTSPEYLQGLASLNEGRAVVTQTGKSESARLAEKNADDTAKVEQEAYRNSLPAMQRHEQEILDTYTERTKQYGKMLADQQISQADFDRRVAAAARDRNAQLASDAEQQRDKIAGELAPFMSAHPLRALEEFGAHQASLYGAEYLQKMSGGHMPFLGKGKNGQSLADLMHHDPESMKLPTTSRPGAGGASMTEMTLSASVVNLYTGTLRDGGGAGGGPGGGDAGVGAGSSPALATFSGTGSPMHSMVAASNTAAHMGGSVQDLGAQIFGRNGVAMPVARIGPSGAAGGSTLDIAHGGGAFGGGAPSAPGMGTTAFDPTLGMVGTPQAATDPGLGMIAAPTGFTPGTPGAVGASNDVNAAMGDFGQVTGIGQTISGNSGDSSSGGGDPSAAGTGGNGASTALGTIGAYGSAGAGLFSAVESNGGVGGALQGAASGAKLGALVGGPAGALVGAGLGAIVGAIGIGGAQKAIEYERKEVRPHLAGTLLAFGMGTMPYQSAYSDLQGLDHTAQQTTRKFGPGGVREYNDHIKVEIQTGLSQLTREQKAGRSQYGMSAAQFDGGGQIRGFGDLGTGPDSGWIHAQRGEVVMHQLASETHGDALGLMLGNATRRQMADYYGAREMAPVYRSTMQQAAFGGGSVTNHYGHTINAVDAKSVSDLLMSQKHVIRSAVTQSYAENSGGADLG